MLPWDALTRLISSPADKSQRQNGAKVFSKPSISHVDLVSFLAACFPKICSVCCNSIALILALKAPWCHQRSSPGEKRWHNPSSSPALASCQVRCPEMAAFLLEKITGPGPSHAHAQVLDGASPGTVALVGWETQSQPVLLGGLGSAPTLLLVWQGGKR